MDLLPLLRECKQLDEKRATSSLTPAEHGRWLELKDRLGAQLRVAQQWLWRGDWDLAIVAARKLEDGPEAEAARRIIADAQLSLDNYYNNPE